MPNKENIRGQSVETKSPFIMIQNCSNVKNAAVIVKVNVNKVIARQEVLGRVGAALTPDEEASGARLQELATQLAAPPLYNTVRPYTPRQFPLTEDTYVDMLSVMPLGYRPSSPEPTPPRLEDEDDESTLSSLSPIAFEGDDPDDVEWDPNSEKADKRRTGYR